MVPVIWMTEFSSTLNKRRGCWSVFESESLPTLSQNAQFGSCTGESNNNNMTDILLIPLGKCFEDKKDKKKSNLNERFVCV